MNRVDDIKLKVVVDDLFERFIPFEEVIGGSGKVLGGR